MKEIADKLFLAVADEEKLFFEEYSYKISRMIEENARQLIINVAELRIIAVTIKDDQLIQKIDGLEHHFKDKGKYLLNEAAKLKLVPELPGADAKFKVRELKRVLEEVADSSKESSEQINSTINELKPYIKAKRRKNNLISLGAFLLTILLNSGTYVFISYGYGIIPSEMIGFTSWLLTGLLLVYLLILILNIFSKLCIKYILKIRNKIIKRIVYFSSLLILAIFAVEPH